MLRNVLKQVAYLILLILNYIFNEWLEYFYNADFEVMNHPFVFTHNAVSVQNRIRKLFSQIGAEFALVARHPCKSCGNFKPYFIGSSQHIQSSVPD